MDKWYSDAKHWFKKQAPVDSHFGGACQSVSPEMGMDIGFERPGLASCMEQSADGIKSLQWPDQVRWPCKGGYGKKSHWICTDLCNCQCDSYVNMLL